MKNLWLVVLVIAMGLFLSCNKDNLNNGSILVKTNFKEDPVPYAMVYISTDTSKSAILFKRADAIGEVYFDKIQPGHYYIYANGSISLSNQQVYGLAQLDIVTKSRQNHYVVIINTMIR